MILGGIYKISHQIQKQINNKLLKNSILRID